MPQRTTLLRAAKPDHVLGWVQKGCAQELTGALTDIFNTSLYQAEVPVCFKRSTSILVPKCQAVKCMNDCCP